MVGRRLALTGAGRRQPCLHRHRSTVGCRPGDPTVHAKHARPGEVGQYFHKAIGYLAYLSAKAGTEAWASVRLAAARSGSISPTLAGVSAADRAAGPDAGDSALVSRHCVSRFSGGAPATPPRSCRTTAASWAQTAGRSRPPSGAIVASAAAAAAIRGQVHRLRPGRAVLDVVLADSVDMDEIRGAYCAWRHTLRDNQIVKASAFFDALASNELWQLSAVT